MIVTLESTDEIGTIGIKAGASQIEMPARVWVGKTMGGHPIMAFITRLASIGDPAQRAAADAELQHDLEEASGNISSVVDHATLPTSMEDFGRREDAPARDRWHTLLDAAREAIALEPLDSHLGLREALDAFSVEE